VTRWVAASGGDAGEGYAARFARLAATGRDVHGEAQLCASLVQVPARVLDAGCGTGRVAIRLAELGYDCVGVDVDPSMLAQARRAAPQLPWLLADLATLDLATLDLATLHMATPGVEAGFHLVVAAGNVVPLVAEGSEPAVVRRLAGQLRGGGLLVAGFGLDAAHLPCAAAPVTLAGYDEMCAEAGLVLEQRFATWDRESYDGGGYAVSVHRRTTSPSDHHGAHTP
jgi:SAM-dependent methyltransferase